MVVSGSFLDTVLQTSDHFSTNEPNLYCNEVICDCFQWYFYVRRRHQAQEWKIQPNKWMSPELERHEILFGSCSLFVTSSFSAFLACYIYNGNPSAVYYQFDEFGWLWFILQFPAIFIYAVRCLQFL